MATRGGSGQLFEMIRDGGQENERLGQAFVLFGLLSVVGGLGLFALTEWYRFDEGVFVTYRRAAVGFAGYGLPAFLYGLVVARGGRPEVKIALVGGLLSTVAASVFLSTYFGWWEVLASPVYVVMTLAVYAIGTILGAIGAGAAILLAAEPDAQKSGTGDGGDSESEFIWGEPPEE